MNYFKLPKVGLRTFKSGLAVFLCLLLIPNEPFFACLTAVICLGDTVTNSVRTGINRGVGTIIGAFSGLLFQGLSHKIYLMHNIMDQSKHEQ